MAKTLERAEQYSAKLKDPRWWKKRLKILERDKWTCQKQLCLDTESTLMVHHRLYLPNTEPWDYPDELLVTLCEDCHEEEKVNSPGIEQSLIYALRENFLSESISNIAIGFHMIEDLPHLPEVTADAIGWAIGDPTALKEIVSRYFEYLHKKHCDTLRVVHG